MKTRSTLNKSLSILERKGGGKKKEERYKRENKEKEDENKLDLNVHSSDLSVNISS